MIPAPMASMSGRFAASALVLFASLGVGLAVAGPSSRVWVYLAFPVILLASATVVSWLRSRPHARPIRLAGRTLPDGLLVLPFVLLDLGVTVGPSLATGAGETTEMLLLSCLRGGAIGLLACAGPRQVALSASLAAFLLVFSAALVPAGARGFLLTAGSAAATLFLLVRHLSRAHLAGQTSHRRFALLPSLALLLTITAVASVVALLTSGDHAASRGLYSLVRASGGDAQGDDRARTGIGDGRDEVRGGQNAQTSGFDRGDLFVNSDHPGLYDAFIESFGEPVRKSEQLKLIGLKQNQILTSDAHTRQDLRTGRSLQLRRSPPRPADAEADRAAGALLLVRGTTPLRLRLAVYDAFDPDELEWIPAPTPKQNAAWYPNAGGPGWMRPVDPPSSPMLGAEVAHEVRIGDFESDVLPLPDHLTAFKLGRVDRADWFAGTPSQVVRLFGRRMPAGSVLDVRSRPADPALGSSDPPLLASRPTTSAAPTPINPAVAELAAQWTRGIAPGWEQVRAVESALRHLPELAGPASAPTSRPEPVADPAAFLRSPGESRSPQYASAAALMLRSLGYQTRLAVGFYVPPDRTDPASGLTPVRGADAHVWPEVRTASGLWVAIEPTPGYLLTPASPTFSARLAMFVGRVIEFAPAWVPTLMAGVVAFWFRARLTDLLATVWWRLSLPREARAAAVTTLRLLELRAQLAGRPRAPGVTVRAFLHLHQADPEVSRVFEWASYAPSAAAPPDSADIPGVCRKAVHTLRFTVLSRPPADPIGPGIGLPPAIATP